MDYVNSWVEVLIKHLDNIIKRGEWWVITTISWCLSDNGERTVNLLGFWTHTVDQTRHLNLKVFT
jgi:hypothetical protein